VADRVDVDVAILHLGEVQFPITGPVRYSMTAEDGVELCGLVQPRVAVPVHYEGWSHFHEGRAVVERTLAAASPEIRSRFRLLDLGTPINV
jgi:L-ascorbate metabolism protein UlaG (beta-lactamase superfamily)